MELPEDQFSNALQSRSFQRVPPIIPRRIALTESFLGAASIEGNQGELDGADF
jgi:hypothetical protein